MDEKLIETILANTYTKSSLYRRLALFRSYLEHKHFTKSGFRRLSDFLEEREVSKDDAQAVEAWSKVFTKKLSRSTFYKKLGAVRKEIADMPSVTVYLPFSAQEGELVKIGQWFRKHVKKQLMMDVRVDPAVVGGCAIVWKGYYRDFSLHQKFSEKKEEIAQEIEKYSKDKDGPHSH